MPLYIISHVIFCSSKVSEAILPSFNLEGEDSVGLHVASYAYSSNPNRLNPRLPGAKRSDHEENELKSLLDESGKAI